MSSETFYADKSFDYGNASHLFADSSSLLGDISRHYGGVSRHYGDSSSLLGDSSSLLGDSSSLLGDSSSLLGDSSSLLPYHAVIHIGKPHKPSAIQSLPIRMPAATLGHPDRLIKYDTKIKKWRTDNTVFTSWLIVVWESVFFQLLLS